MKIAAYLDAGRPCAGIVSPDLQSIVPFELASADAAFGALRVVELIASGAALPATAAPVALGAVQLIAPLPRPSPAAMSRSTRSCSPRCPSA